MNWVSWGIHFLTGVPLSSCIWKYQSWVDSAPLSLQGRGSYPALVILPHREQSSLSPEPFILLKCCGFTQGCHLVWKHRQMVAMVKWLNNACGWGTRRRLSRVLPSGGCITHGDSRQNRVVPQAYSSSAQPTGLYVVNEGWHSEHIAF